MNWIAVKFCGGKEREGGINVAPRGAFEFRGGERGIVSLNLCPRRRHRRRRRRRPGNLGTDAMGDYVEFQSLLHFSLSLHRGKLSLLSLVPSFLFVTVRR